MYTLVEYNKQINLHSLAKSIEALIPYGVTFSHEDRDWVITSTMVQPLIDFVRWIYTGSPELYFRMVDIRGLHDTTPDTYQAIRESLMLMDNLRLRFFGRAVSINFRSSKPFSYRYRIHGSMMLSVTPPPFVGSVHYLVGFVSDIPVPTPEEIPWVIR